jgi:hypothetical protein
MDSGLAPWWRLAPPLPSAVKAEEYAAQNDKAN